MIQSAALLFGADRELALAMAISQLEDPPSRSICLLRVQPVRALHTATNSESHLCMPCMQQQTVSLIYACPAATNSESHLCMPCSHKQ